MFARRAPLAATAVWAPLTAATLAFGCGFGAAACRSKPAAAPPAPRARVNVLLITLDTLRPDALGFVSGKNSTPAIDRLAREGFAFPSAISPVPLTFPAHCALMTGKLPRALGLRDNGQLLAPDPPTLATRLAESGYSTAAFVSGYPLHSTFGLNRGFAHYDDALGAAGDADPERDAFTTVSAAREWLAAAHPPWFLWVHLYDPHYPYDPPKSYRRPGPRGAYDGEVAYADAAIGRLREAAGAATGGLQTLTVFAGDHGESLGEHGEGTHGFFIYDSTVLVPLIFHLPGRIPAGSSASGARLIDVAPTILELVDRPALEALSGVGVSLAPLFRNPGSSGEPAYVETYQPWLSYGWAPLRSMRSEGWKLIDAPRPELYDLRTDPGELQNRLANSPEQARRLKTLLDRVQAAPAAAARPAADAEALAKLRSLGYLGGSAPGQEPPAQGLRDPKDGGALRELLTEGDALLRRREPRAAAIRFEAALEQDPHNRFALHRSGVALLQLNQLPRAIARLEKAAGEDTDQPEVHWALADALGRSGRFAEAASQWREVLRLQPRRAQAWASLGTALGQAGKSREAVSAIGHAVELSPKDPDLLARLAFAEFGAGDLEAAVRHLTEEAHLRPAGDFRHAGALGILFARLGRKEPALDWLARSRPQEPEYAEARLTLASLQVDAGREAEARRALAEAIRAAPQLRSRARADARLAPLLP